MPLLINHINRFAWFYLACFLFNFSWLIIDGNLLTQYQPVFFINRLDVSLNFLMLSKLHKLILNNSVWCYVIDGLYFMGNISLVIFYLKNSKYLKILCVLAILVNLTFALLISVSEIYTIERLIPNFIVPILLYKKDLKWFYFSLHIIRLVFIIIFFSAALWKIRTGAIYNTEQMSGILIHQHTPYLTVNASNVYGKFILYLINHKLLAYSLYFFGFLMELIFCVGFFTKKYDKVLILLFIGFIILNLTLMRIDYLNWVVFVACLYWSSKEVDVVKIN